MEGLGVDDRRIARGIQFGRFDGIVLALPSLVEVQDFAPAVDLVRRRVALVPRVLVAVGEPRRHPTKWLP